MPSSQQPGKNSIGGSSRNGDQHRRQCLALATHLRCGFATQQRPTLSAALALVNVLLCNFTTQQHLKPQAVSGASLNPETLNPTQTEP
jgi:hypothetical protein